MGRMQGLHCWESGYSTRVKKGLTGNGPEIETQDQNSQGKLGRKAEGQTRQLAGLGSALNLANMIELGARG